MTQRGVVVVTGVGGGRQGLHSGRTAVVEVTSFVTV